MFTFAPAARRSAAPTFSRKNDWGGVLAQAQQLRQANDALHREVDALGSAVVQFVNATRAQVEAFRAKIAELRQRAQEGDMAFEHLEDNYYFEDDVPAEFINVLDDTYAGFDGQLDEVENALDELGL
jgi:uncharacterized coiled-coil DUF342 family protein